MSGYFYVHLGPKPTIDGVPTPKWHPLSEASSYPFPTLAAAERFAHAHREPGRVITVKQSGALT